MNLRSCLFLLIFSLITPNAVASTTVISSPIIVTSNGQIIESLTISATNEPAILILGFSNVIIRNVQIVHKGGGGINAVGATGLLIEDTLVANIAVGVPLPDSGQVNIVLESSPNSIIRKVRLEGGSSGIYVLTSSNVHLSFIEGYNFRGPIPRGQLVQFDKSPFCTLEDFSVINENLNSWPEDNVSVFQSDNCVIRRGLLDGNNSPSGVGVMFEGSKDGLVEDVDTVRQGNGSFFAFPGTGITFRRTRARDNICGDQGRGVPSSGGLVWGAGPGSTNIQILDSKYFNLCAPNNIAWDQTLIGSKEWSSSDFTPRSQI